MIYLIILGVLCWVQLKVTVQGIQSNILRVDGWPVLGYVVFNTISVALIAISRFRELQRHDTRVTESKEAVLMHLIFWGLSNIFSYGFLIC